MFFIATTASSAFFDWLVEHGSFEASARQYALSELIESWISSGDGLDQCIGKYAYYMQVVVLIIDDVQRDGFRVRLGSGDGERSNAFLAELVGIMHGSSSMGHDDRQRGRFIDPEWFEHHNYEWRRRRCTS